MAARTSLVRRVGTAKAIGFLVGLVGFFMVPSLMPEEGILLRFGILLWYTVFGAVIGAVATRFGDEGDAVR
jgi:hypothetical protein